MTIAQMREVSNRALSRVPKDVLVVLLVLSTSILAFLLGMLSERQMHVSEAGKGSGVWIENIASGTPAVLGASAVGAAAAAASQTQKNTKPAVSHVSAPSSGGVDTTVPSVGTYVASKNGTKYYLPTCSGAKRIKAENRVWFVTVADAEASGRTPATNCPGL